MAMLALGNAILLGGMWARNTVSNTRASKVGMEAMILTTPIGLDSANFSIQQAFYMRLKSVEDAFNVRFMLNQVNPRITAVVINEANIILKASGRRQSRTPNISMNKLKRRLRHTGRITIW
jgi:alanine dehydrogenase